MVSPTRELTPSHIAVLEYLVGHGFTPVAFPMYASAVGIRRGPFAALLEAADGESFRLLGQAFYVIEGNLSVRIQSEGREFFVWKGRKVEATPELVAEQGRFSKELSALLSPIPPSPSRS